MKVDKTIEDYNKKQLEGLEKKQRNLITNRENEIEKISKNFDTEENRVKLRNQTDILELTDKHNQDLGKEFVREEEYLANYQKDLQNQKQLYEKSLLELRRSNEQELKNIQNKHTIDMETKFVNHLGEEKTINDKINQDKTTFHQDAIREIKDAKHKEFLSVQDAKFEVDKNVSKSRASLSSSSPEGIIEQKEMTRMKHEKQLEIDRQAKANYVAENQLKGSHQFQLNQEEQKFKESIMTQKSLFEKKINDAEGSQKEVLTRIQEKFKNDLKALSESHSQKKTIHENKLNDSFYRLTNLEPQIVDNEKEYHISLRIPEHEKDNVQLTAQGRLVHLGFTRRFNDSITSQDGAKVSSSRTEAVSKEFNVPEILDSKKIVQKYENGKLTFKIAKL